MLITCEDLCVMFYYCPYLIITASSSFHLRFFEHASRPLFIRPHLLPRVEREHLPLEDVDEPLGDEGQVHLLEAARLPVPEEDDAPREALVVDDDHVRDAERVGSGEGVGLVADRDPLLLGE